MVAVAFLLGNVSAMVDAVLHPEIPYFDQEHLIVGGITAVMSLSLSFLLLLSLRQLEKAKERIDHLEAILPICAHCKKIRESDTDPRRTDSWQTLELYITEHTRTQFSHGICPECRTAHYPEHVHVPSPEDLSHS